MLRIRYISLHAACTTKRQNNMIWYWFFASHTIFIKLFAAKINIASCTKYIKLSSYGCITSIVLINMVLYSHQPHFNWREIIASGNSSQYNIINDFCGSDVKMTVFGKRQVSAKRPRRKSGRHGFARIRKIGNEKRYKCKYKPLGIKLIGDEGSFSSQNS